MDAELSKLLEIYGQFRKNWPICTYRPSKKQHRFHNSRCPIRMIRGANQSGKTHAGTAEDISMAAGFHPWLHPTHPSYRILNAAGEPMPVPNHGRLYITDFDNVLKETILPKLKELIPGTLYRVEKNNQGIPNQIVFAWGSTIKIMSHSQDTRVSESGTFHWAHYDEPVPRDMRVAARRGLIRHAGLELFTMTGLYESWIDDEIDPDDPDVLVIQIDMDDNSIPNGGVLPVRGIQLFEKSLTPEEAAIRMHGLSAATFTRCCPDFRKQRPWVCANFDVPDDWPRVAIIDPHERKPDCIVWVAFHPLGKFGVVYDAVMDTSTQGRVEKAAATVLTREHRFGTPVVRLMDPRFAQKNLRDVNRTMLEEYAMHGVRCTPAPALGLREGYRMLNSWFHLSNLTHMPFLRVMERCELVIRSLTTTKWNSEYGKVHDSRPVLGFDDPTSCLRYLRTAELNVESLQEMSYLHNGGMEDMLQAAALFKEIH